MLDLHKIWSEFLEVWPPERLRQITLEEYTNPGKDNAFIYWIEKRVEELGSIWGGSAFKFGIYYRDNVEEKEASRGRIWGEKYAWLAKYGKNKEEAFNTVRERLVEVLDAVEGGQLARIEEIDLSPVLKWKVAFLYQDRKAPLLFPIYKKEALFYHYRNIDPTAKLAGTPYYVMYETLGERFRELGDVFDIAQTLWDGFEKDRIHKPRAWAVPLEWILDPEAIKILTEGQRVEPEDIDALLDNLLAAVDLAEGDELALLVEGDVVALGTLTSVGPEQYAWDQIPIRFPSGLLVNPTAEIRELDASERQEIWSHVPEKEGVSKKEDEKPPRYWKIAPGSDGVAWPDWQRLGIAAIGWPELGDLAHIDRAGFDERAKECGEKYGYKQGMKQVWTFRQIRPGDRVVANKGTRTLLGIGTVVEGYQFNSGKHFIDGEDFPHQILVRWDETTSRSINQGGWRRTLVELSVEDFAALLEPRPDESTKEEKPEPPPRPCDPKNVILYGPPGTGKTYSTVRRALELILGARKLEGLTDKGLTALFREHQARGQVEFVTFHQAYGYEEFVEGIRPVLDKGESQDVRYELHHGVFKRIALRAAADGLILKSVPPDFDDLWNRFVQEIQGEDSRIAQGQSGKNYRLELSSRGNVIARPCEIDSEGNVVKLLDKHQTASKDNVKLYWDHRDELGPEPEKLSYEKTTTLFAREHGGQGGNHYTALWIVYTQLYELSRGASARKQELVDPIKRVQQILDKPIIGGASFSFSAQTRQYVLIIDEINRGNMSKILGELITLIEPDKRLGEANELKLPLSYSPEHRFAVPPNLHVLGTMNTADRSIALMDVALRRRFTFEELLPDAGVIRDVLSKTVPDKALIDLVVDLFEILNARIRFLYDQDHQLGHAYFLQVQDLRGLQAVFVDRILPLLQEYFYGSWEKICTVLGCPYDDTGEPLRSGFLVTTHEGRKVYKTPIVAADVFAEVQTIGFDHDDYEDRLDYRVRTNFQRGQLSDERLIRTFLGVLELDKDDFEQRTKLLLGNGVASPDQKT